MNIFRFDNENIAEKFLILDGYIEGGTDPKIVLKETIEMLENNINILDETEKEIISEYINILKGSTIINGEGNIYINDGIIIFTFAEHATSLYYKFTEDRENVIIIYFNSGDGIIYHPIDEVNTINEKGIERRMTYIGTIKTNEEFMEIINIIKVINSKKCKINTDGLYELIISKIFMSTNEYNLDRTESNKFIYLEDLVYEELCEYSEVQTIGDCAGRACLSHLLSYIKMNNYDKEHYTNIRNKLKREIIRKMIENIDEKISNNSIFNNTKTDTNNINDLLNLMNIIKNEYARDGIIGRYIYEKLEIINNKIIDNYYIDENKPRIVNITTRTISNQENMELDGNFLNIIYKFNKVIMYKDIDNILDIEIIETISNFNKKLYEYILSGIKEKKRIFMDDYTEFEAFVEDEDKMIRVINVIYKLISRTINNVYIIKTCKNLFNLLKMMIIHCINTTNRIAESDIEIITYRNTNIIIEEIDKKILDLGNEDIYKNLKLDKKMIYAIKQIQTKLQDKTTKEILNYITINNSSIYKYVKTQGEYYNYLYLINNFDITYNYKKYETSPLNNFIIKLDEYIDDIVKISKLKKCYPYDNNYMDNMQTLGYYEIYNIGGIEQRERNKKKIRRLIEKLKNTNKVIIEEEILENVLNYITVYNKIYENDKIIECEVEMIKKKYEMEKIDGSDIKEIYRKLEKYDNISDKEGKKYKLSKYRISDNLIGCYLDDEVEVNLSNIEMLDYEYFIYLEYYLKKMKNKVIKIKDKVFEVHDNNFKLINSTNYYKIYNINFFEMKYFTINNNTYLEEANEILLSCIDNKNIYVCNSLLNKEYIYDKDNKELIYEENENNRLILKRNEIKMLYNGVELEYYEEIDTKMKIYVINKIYSISGNILSCKRIDNNILNIYFFIIENSFYEINFKLEINLIANEIKLYYKNYELELNNKFIKRWELGCPNIFITKENKLLLINRSYGLTNSINYWINSEEPKTHNFENIGNYKEYIIDFDILGIKLNCMNEGINLLIYTYLFYRNINCLYAIIKYIDINNVYYQYIKKLFSDYYNIPLFSFYKNIIFNNYDYNYVANKYYNINYEYYKNINVFSLDANKCLKDYDLLKKNVLNYNNDEHNDNLNNIYYDIVINNWCSYNLSYSKKQIETFICKLRSYNRSDNFNKSLVKLYKNNIINFESDSDSEYESEYESGSGSGSGFEYESKYKYKYKSIGGDRIATIISRIYELYNNYKIILPLNSEILQTYIFILMYQNLTIELDETEIKNKENDIIIIENILEKYENINVNYKRNPLYQNKDFIICYVSKILFSDIDIINFIDFSTGINMIELSEIEEIYNISENKEQYINNIKDELCNLPAYNNIIDIFNVLNINSISITQLQNNLDNNIIKYLNYLYIQLLFLNKFGFNLSSFIINNNYNNNRLTFIHRLRHLVSTYSETIKQVFDGVEEHKGGEPKDDDSEEEPDDETEEEPEEEPEEELEDDLEEGLDDDTEEELEDDLEEGTEEEPADDYIYGAYDYDEYMREEDRTEEKEIEVEIEEYKEEYKKEIMRRIEEIICETNIDIRRRGYNLGNQKRSIDKLRRKIVENMEDMRIKRVIKDVYNELKMYYNSKIEYDKMNKENKLYESRIIIEKIQKENEVEYKEDEDENIIEERNEERIEYNSKFSILRDSVIKYGRIKKKMIREIRDKSYYEKKVNNIIEKVKKKIKKYDPINIQNIFIKVVDKQDKLLDEIINIKSYMNVIKLYQEIEEIEEEEDKKIMNEEIRKIITNTKIEDRNMKNTLLKLYELSFGYKFKEEQLILIEDIIYYISDKESNMYQMLMGGGKTSVIIPYLNLYYVIIEEKVVFNILPESLVNQTYEIFKNYIKDVFSVSIEILKIDRNNDKEETKKIKKNTIYIMSDISYKSFYLNMILNNPLDPNLKILQKSIILFDEVDMIGDTFTSELNYPSDEAKTPKNIEKETKIIMDIIDIIYRNNEYETVNLVSDNNYEEIIERSRKELVEYISSKLKSGNIDYIWNKRLRSREIEIDEENIIYIKLFDNTIPMILKLLHKKDFGFVDNKDDKVYNYIAIPYLGFETPAYDSEKKTNSDFSDYYIKIGLTYISYKAKNGKITEIQKRKYIKYIEDLYKSELLLFDIYDRELKTNNKKLLKIINKTEEEMTEEERNIIIRELTIYNTKNYVKVNKEYYNINFVDIISKNVSNNNNGFTGTPFFYIPYSYNQRRNKIKKEFEIIPSLLDTGKTISGLTNKFTSVTIYSKNNLESIIGNYDVIIDVGALFIDKSSYENIKRFREMIRTKKYYIYIDSNHKKKYITREDDTVKEFNEGLELKDRFIFYDQGHITGQDFKLLPTARGIITIKENTIFRDVAQGAFRLRNLNNGQKIDYMMNTEGNENIELRGESLYELIDNLYKNNNNELNKKEKLGYVQNMMRYLKENDKTKGKYKIIEETTNEIRNINDVKVDEMIREKNDKYMRYMYERYLCIKEDIINMTTNIQINVDITQEISKSQNMNSKVEMTEQRNIKDITEDEKYGFNCLKMNYPIMYVYYKRIITPEEVISIDMIYPRDINIIYRDYDRIMKDKSGREIYYLITENYEYIRIGGRDEVSKEIKDKFYIYYMMNKILYNKYIKITEIFKLIEIILNNSRMAEIYIEMVDINYYEQLYNYINNKKECYYVALLKDLPYYLAYFRNYQEFYVYLNNIIKYLATLDKRNICFSNKKINIMVKLTIFNLFDINIINSTNLINDIYCNLHKLNKLFKFLKVNLNMYTSYIEQNNIKKCEKEFYELLNSDDIIFFTNIRPDITSKIIKYFISSVSITV